MLQDVEHAGVVLRWRAETDGERLVRVVVFQEEKACPRCVVDSLDRFSIDFGELRFLAYGEAVQRRARCDFHSCTFPSGMRFATDISIKWLGNPLGVWL